MYNWTIKTPPDSSRRPAVLFQVVVLCKSKIKPNLNNITNQN